MKSGVRRVAVFAYHSSPTGEPGKGDAGGMTVFVRAVARSLAATGIATDIFTRRTSELDRVQTFSDGTRVIPITAGPPSKISKEEQASYIGEFADGVRAFVLANRFSYDVIHSHYWQSGVAAMKVAKAWGIPHVHSHHTLGRVKNSLLAPGDVPESEERIVGEDSVIAGADVLVASTDEEWRQLACLYGADHDKLKTINPGVDHSMFVPGDRAEARARLGLPEDEKIILYAGRIQPLKGIDLIIRALEQLIPVVGSVRLVVVGGASGDAGDIEVERLERLTEELGVADRVTFAGARPHSELPSFHRAADVVAVASHSESFGLVALEAHACGVPVVATAVGGLSFIVEDGVTGYITGSRDPSEFAGRLKTVLRDPDLAERMGRSAAASSLAFSWEATADKFRELYECLFEEMLPEACTC